MKTNSRFTRKKEVEESKPSILIICEGEKTEPNYFKSFPVKNKKVLGIGYNTVSLVDYATKFITEYDEIWCVFDEDSRKQDFDRAINKCFKNNLKVAYSNESFELWYLLHFNDIQNDVRITRGQYCDKLTEFIPSDRGRDKPKYCKNDQYVYFRLLENQHIAIRRAKKLATCYPNHLNNSNKKPVTTVHLLVERLNQFL